jgi:ATP-dependent exoDNAse (exonuclease V) beta subunit
MPSLQAVLSAAVAGGPTVSWSSSTGDAHVFQVCTRGQEAAPVDLRHLAATSDVDPDFQALDDDGPVRASASDDRDVSSSGSAPAAAFGRGRESDRVVGTLVHRLLQREGLTSGGDDARLRRIAWAILGSRSFPQVDDPARLVDQAVTAFRALLVRPDIQTIYRAGEAFHEVPFSVAAGGDFVRGTIDCLVRAPDNRVTVLEFKTGRKRVDHQAQVDIYRQAAQALFPEDMVEAVLVYAGDPEEAPHD